MTMNWMKPYDTIEEANRASEWDEWEQQTIAELKAKRKRERAQ